MNAYVMLYPHSNANPSGKYRICQYGAWVEYVNGQALDYLSEDFDDIQSALSRRAQLNDALIVQSQQ